jgi:energy-coupling factor transporter ATP-binding protein EcfA2
LLELLLISIEPTSGLNANTALNVMRIVKKISLTGRSVLCTIHQPSADVFSFFDNMLLLKSGGRTVYFGELGEDCTELIHYFEQITDSEGNRFNNKPVTQNPASWMLDVVGAGIAQHSASSTLDYAEIYLASELHRKHSDILRALKETVRTSHLTELKTSDYHLSSWTQFSTLAQRQFSNYWRDEKANIGRFFNFLIVALLMGIVFVQVGSNGYAALNSKVSAVFMIVSFLALSSEMTTELILNSNRDVYYREKASNAYQTWHYSTVLTIVEWPYCFFSSVAVVVIVYFIVGFEANAALFFQFEFATFLAILVESAIGFWSAATFPNPVVSTQISGTLNTLFFLFGGLYIRPVDIPSGWKCKQQNLKQ